jgi:dolichol kinase
VIRAIWICTIGAAIGAIAESLPVRLDDNLTVSITSGAAMAFLPALLPI